MLDIISELLDLKGLNHGRIDGGQPGNDRQRTIDAFNAEDNTNDMFVMLLSTRAEGLGINLTQAARVIIYDR